MEQQLAKATAQGEGALKPWLTSLAVFQLLIILAAILGQGIHPLLFLLQITTWAVAGMILWAKGARPRKLAIGLLGAVLTVIIVSMIGFYANAQISYGEFSKGRTQVSSRSAGNALGSALTDPAAFTATLFGYECDDPLGLRCSNGLYYLGVGLVEVIFASGIAIGATWGRRDRSFIPKISN